MNTLAYINLKKLSSFKSILVIEITVDVVITQNKTEAISPVVIKLVS